MIAVKDLTKLYKQGNTVVHALKGINLSLSQGTVFGLIGRPGAGKSALIRCINLLESPTRGSIVIDSCELNSLNTKALREARRHIGMVFEHCNLLQSRSIYENIAFPLEIMGHTPSQIESSVRPLLNLIGLSHKADAPIQILNPAQKQMVAIMKALAPKPKILLCEEITAALDAKAKHTVLQLLKEIKKRLQTTMILISHELDVIKTLCDRVGVLQQGTLIEENTLLDFYTHPQSEFGREFIKTAARLEIPSSIRARLRPQPLDEHHPILRLSFDEPASQESFIAALAHQFHVRVNILQANLEQISSKTLGLMLIEVIADPDEVKRAIQFLEQHKIYVEVLGYAPRIT
jgi:D-methionine transport system ATP-binding protein